MVLLDQPKDLPPRATCRETRGFVSSELVRRWFVVVSFSFRSFHQSLLVLLHVTRHVNQCKPSLHLLPFSPVHSVGGSRGSVVPLLATPRAPLHDEEAKCTGPLALQLAEAGRRQIVKSSFASHLTGAIYQPPSPRGRLCFRRRGETAAPAVPSGFAEGGSLL